MVWKVYGHTDRNMFGNIEKTICSAGKTCSVKSIALTQSVLLLLLVYFTEPCKFDLPVECFEGGNKYEENEFKLVGINNFLVLVYGLIATFLFYTKDMNYSEKLSKRARKAQEHLTSVLNFILIFYIWLLMSIYFWNPFQISLANDYTNSINSTIFIFIKGIVRGIFYVLALPISLTQTYRSYRLFVNTNSQRHFYFQSNIFIIAFLLTMQGLLLWKLQIDDKNEKKHDRKPNGSVLNVCDITKESKNSESTVEIETDANKETSISKASHPKSKSASVTLPHHIGNEYLTQCVENYDQKERPFLVDSPTKSKPINIAKPVNITKPLSICTSPKILLKSNKTDKSSQTRIKNNTKVVSKLQATTQTENVSLINETVPRKKSLSLNKRSTSFKKEDKKIKLSCSYFDKDTQTQLSKSDQSCQIEMQFNPRNFFNIKARLSSHNLDNVNIEGKTKKLIDVSTKTLDAKKESKGVQVESSPMSSFSYDKGIQCSLITNSPQSKNNLNKANHRKSFTDKCVETKHIDQKNKYVQTIDTKYIDNNNNDSNSSNKEQINSIKETVQSLTELSDEKIKNADPILFEASRCYDNLWYISLRSDIFLSLSYDIIKYNDKIREYADNKFAIDTTDEIVSVMKLYVENFRKLSTCFDVDEESDDESFINGFRL